MIWVLLIGVAVLLVGVFAAMATGRLAYDPMAEATSTEPDATLPAGFSARDISGVRFDTALRGYRMSQVDALLDQLQERLAAQEAELAQLRGAGPTAPDEPPA